MHWLGVVGMTVVVGLMVFFAFNTPIPPLPNRDQEIGYRFGFFIWPFFIGTFIAWLVAGRKKRRNPNLFAILFCSIAAGFVGLTVVGSLRATGSLPFQRPEITEQKMGRLMREAAGLQPVHKPLFGENKLDTWTRDLFRELITVNKQYQQEAHKLDTKDIASLGTPASLSDPDSATAGLQEVHARYKLHALQEQRTQELLDNFKHHLSDLSSPDSKAYIKGMEEGFARVMPVRHKALAAEEAWMVSLDELYSFARIQHSKITLSTADHLIITDNKVREQFNARIRAMNSRRHEYLQASRDFAALQNTTLQKFGLTGKETGIR